jgi:hypothetical protein
MKNYKILQHLGSKVRVKCVCGKKYKIRKDRLNSYNCKCEDINLEGGVKSLYKRYKYSANKRGYEFKLSEDYFEKVISQNCFYCNSDPRQVIGKIEYNGIGRLSNDEGYTECNTVSCCGKCNKAKGTMDLGEFEDWVEKVYKFIKQKELECMVKVKGLDYIKDNYDF